MLARIIPRAFRTFHFLRMASLVTLPKACFAINRERIGESNEKSEEDRIYMQEEEDSSWINNYDDIVSDFPFYSIPIGIIRNPNKFPFKEEQLQNLVAFKVINAREDDIKLAAQILFPQHNQKDFSGMDGRRLYSTFMEKRFSTLIKGLNKGSGSLEERITSLIILNNVSNDMLTSERVQKIDPNALLKQDNSGVLLAYYVQLIVRHDLQCNQFLQTIHDRLQDPKLDAKSRLKIAKTIFLTPHFQDNFSRKILEAAVAAVTLNIEHMHNYELLFIIRNIYNYHTLQSKRFAEAIQKHLIQKHVDQNSLDFHIPLILKVIRYCYLLRVPTNDLLEFIAGNMKRFQVIFDRKRVSKGVFFNLLFSKADSKQTSPELVAHLKSYFLDGLTEFTSAEESDSNEILRFNKLLLKYFDYFSEKEQEHFKEKYIEKMIPYYATSNEVLFYSILVYLRVKKPEEEGTGGKEPSPSEIKDQQTLKKYIQMFLLRCCRKTNEDELLVKSNINEVIEMVYQIHRHGLKFTRYELPQICKYDFTQTDTLRPEMVNNLFYYLLKTHEKRDAIRDALYSAETVLENFIRNDRLNSFKTIYCMIDVCQRVHFEHDFFYKALENALVNCLIRQPKFVIIEKDLKFLNEKMIKRGYGSPGLKKLIIETLQKPRNWQVLRKAYIDNQIEFRQKLSRKRREERQGPRRSQ